jgi:hypothetical protein
MALTQLAVHVLAGSHCSVTSVASENPSLVLKLARGAASGEMRVLGTHGRRNRAGAYELG